MTRETTSSGLVDQYFGIGVAVVVLPPARAFFFFFGGGVGDGPSLGSTSLV